ncbi:hypothetical protein GCM10025771_22480 [Niveibacterium umoris]|uniref:Uncharacterized protein n=1 Tax=Niveibacterium umoris TaxID=1193620 RepID=A0A840BIV1_9RHOO|nr:hypothetical protein [Niveibacterium umoris]MBB4012563.1 hypothetical protein [Niveibacterium umoris]
MQDNTRANTSHHAKSIALGVSGRPPRTASANTDMAHCPDLLTPPRISLVEIARVEIEFSGIEPDALPRWLARHRDADAPR